MVSTIVLLFYILNELKTYQFARKSNQFAHCQQKFTIIIYSGKDPTFQ